MQKTLATLALGTSLLTLVSCGDHKSSSAQPSTSQLQQQETQGFYKATLSPLNAAIAGSTLGVMTFKIEGDEVEADVSIEGAPALVVHKQSIFIGSQCPQITSDANGDGVIDIKEAQLVSGKIFIPLDSNINSQAAGTNYPVARSTGKYHYSEAASLTSMIADLFSPDENLDDGFVKLEAGQDLNLSGRVVIVQGIAQTTTLPETVATVDDKDAHSLIPIACGVLTRVESSDPITTSNGGKD